MSYAGGTSPQKIRVGTEFSGRHLLEAYTRGAATSIEAISAVDRLMLPS
jgi:hypothetical protein